tara:strand:- start:676 stop:942 length:267 start_codon:yes stop_codon:yes gene_type:complete
MISKKSLGTAIATAAALAFVTAPLTSTFVSAASSKVNCYGVNSCKGESSCKTAKNECKGMNSCKGQGIVMKTAKQCAKLGGSTEEPTS